MAVNEWLLVVIFQAIVLAATLPLLLIPLILTPKGSDPLRHGPFESGQIPIGDARRRYVMQYYPYLIIFVVFDVVAMFLFAWGVAFTGLGFSNSLLVLLFILIIGVPLAYALRLAEKRNLW